MLNEHFLVDQGRARQKSVQKTNLEQRDTNMLLQINGGHRLHD